MSEKLYWFLIENELELTVLGSFIIECWLALAITVLLVGK